MDNKKAKFTGKTSGVVPRGASQPSRGIDMASIIKTAAQALATNQSSLNHADTENQNHGDNMVQVFNMISQVMAKQQGATPSEQLSQASQYLVENSKSGSAQIYSQGLAQAAEKFQGQSAVTTDNAMMLIQSLLGGGQSGTQGGGDLLGSLLGGQQSPPEGGGQQQGGVDLGDILNAGMTFMNAKQQGQNNLQAALSTLIAEGPMGQKPHRQQSGQVVANALLQAVASMAKQK